MISKHISCAWEFHEKFGLGINERKQAGMFERNNLLLEEVGELLEAIKLNDKQEIKSEALDVYYILMGNCTYLGIEDLIINNYNVGIELEITDFVLAASKLAQLTRKKFDEQSYIEQMGQQMIKVIEQLIRVFNDLEELALLFAKHHSRMMNKQVKKIGDVVVVSEFN